ncbi:cupin domain-containing protein [Streptomyces sp. NPDC093252]|uniref:cupin domain-containing protein n=1 Tax=Streptomyces sp. NPDC093252 TaxID=3154980 RepID=UPI0034146F29
MRPLPVEGGLFRQTWAGPPGPDGRPSGTAIIVLLTGGDGGDGPAEGSAGDSTKDSAGDFSALHRLPTDEVWHFYEGDPLTLLTLFPDGTDRLTRLGGPGGEVQTVVPAGAWMGARVAPGGRWSLFGTTMAPGFLPEDYDGADTEEVERLASHHARHADLIRSLHRADAPGRMTGPDDDTPAG